MPRDENKHKLGAAYKPGGVYQPEHEKKRDDGFIKALSVLSQVGITILVCIALGIFIGRLLDNALNASPWFTLVFTLFGAGAAFKSIFDFSKKQG